MNMHRTIAGRRRAQQLTLLAVLFYAFGLFANGLHFSLFRHEVCEHSELVHVEEATVACEHEVTGEHAHDDRAGERSGELHEHCDIPVSAPSTSVALPFGSAALPLQVVTRAPVHAETPRVETIERLLFAPHHSPPSA